MNVSALLSWVVAAWGSPQLSPAETGQLEQGEIVVRVAAGGEESIAAIDIAAPPREVLAAALDFEYRVDHSSILRRASIYDQGDRSVSVRFEAGMMGFSGTWHAVYRWDADGMRIAYALDPAKDNGLEAMSGTYTLQQIGEGTRVVVESRSRVGGAYPKWLVRSAGKSSTRRMLESLRARAEQGSK